MFGRHNVRLLLLCIAFGTSLSASLWADNPAGKDFIRRSKTDIVGKAEDLNIEFYAVELSPYRILVEIDFGADKQIIGDIDHSSGAILLKSISRGNGRIAVLEEADLSALKGLQNKLGGTDGSLAERTLGRLLNLLYDYPPNEPVELTIAKSAAQPIPEKSIKSLCGVTGQRKTGSYTVGQNKHTETAQVGPCYFKPDPKKQCLGRCGPGCGAPPDPTFQQFTQDCLNHDLCTGFTGTILGECADEWRAAADDFLVGKDCADLDGKWTDINNYIFNLAQSTKSVTGKVTGRVGNIECRPWTISGTHSGSEVILNASTFFQRSGCCNSFKLTGNAVSCTKISGTWTNACQLNGSFTITKQGGRSALSFAPEEDVYEEVTPGSSYQ